jgi:hypothetical protein
MRQASRIPAQSPKENGDRLHRRTLIGFPGESVIGYEENPRQAAEAILALSILPTSLARFTASHLAQKVRAMNGRPEADYGPRRAAYGLKKFRGKGLIRKIGASCRYEPVPEGLRAIAVLLLLREKVIRPLLAAGQPPESMFEPDHPTPVDHH